MEPETEVTNATDIELRDTDTLIPYTNNPKEHPDEQVKKIASSIKNYGWDQPIVVDGDGEIIKGHGRLQAADLLGLSEVPVIERTDLSDAEKQAARIADNKTAESEWDTELLEIEVDDVLAETDLEPVAIGFDDDELGDLIDELDNEESDIEYTDKIKTPVYEPTQDEPPDLSECFDTERFEELQARINDADVSGELERFLRFAAQRHIVFDYENIAEYYSHADPETQELMEALTLVIVDYEQAIEQGFVKYAEDTMEEIEDA